MNCDGEVPLDLAIDETTESLLQRYSQKMGEKSSGRHVVCVENGGGVWSTKYLFFSPFTFKAVVPNPRAMDRYCTVGQLVLVSREKFQDLHFSRFIYLILKETLFWRTAEFSSPQPTHS